MGSLSEISRVARSCHAESELTKIAVQAVRNLAKTGSLTASVPFYDHPLGFLHGKLLSNTGKFDLRLHVWGVGEAGRQESEWMIHDHIWKLESHVIWGSIYDISYAVDCNASEPESCIYRVAYGDDGTSSLHKTSEKCSPCATRRRKLCTGDSYTIEPGSFHESQVAEPTITLVYAHRVGYSESAKVLGPSSGPAERSFNRSPISKDVERAVNAIVRELF